MAMIRRRFLSIAIRGAAFAALPLLRAGERNLPARFVEAVRAARRYPGPVAPLDEASVGRPGRHAG